MVNTKNKTFYDPHPGFLGAAVPLPEKMKEAAEQLSGKVISLEEAIGFLTPIFEAIGGTLVEGNNFILFMIQESSGIKHCYRLIRYRE